VIQMPEPYFPIPKPIKTTGDFRLKIYILLLFIVIIFLFLNPGIIEGQDRDIFNIINSSTVKINLFWSGSKDRSNFLIEESNSLGVLVSPEGHVLTCYHSVILSDETGGQEVSPEKIADTINLEYFYEGNKTSLVGKVVDVDEWRDLALIEPCEKISRDSCVKIKTTGIFNGEEIFYASVDPLNPWNSISSAKLAYSVLNDNGKNVMGFNMNIRAGSSGAGMFDSSGNLVGLIYATGTFTENPGEKEITLVIPAQSVGIFLQRNNVFLF